MNDEQGETPGPTKVAQAPTLRIDVARYQAYLDDPELSAAQKEALIEALWSIIVGFVDLGFGVHPVQQACEQRGPIGASETPERAVVLSSNHAQPETETPAAALRPTARKEAP